MLGEAVSILYGRLGRSFPLLSPLAEDEVIMCSDPDCDCAKLATLINNPPIDNDVF